MDTKYDELSTRIETVDRKAEAAERPAKQNQNNISDLTSESTALQEKIVEQVNKICELQENIEDQVKRNSRDMLVIRDIKKENQEKIWNNTSHMLSHFVDCLDGIQVISLVTLREHTEVFTKTLIHLSM